MSAGTELTITNATVDLAVSVENAEGYVRAARAKNTQRAYDAGWRAFEEWCAARSIDPLPAGESVIGVHLADCAAAGLKTSTISIRLAAIVAKHQDAGHLVNTKAPQIAKVMKGIRRTHGAAPVKKAAVVRDVLRDCVRSYASGETLKAKRNRALLCVGFYGALRRSELVGIDFEHLTFTEEGVVLSLPRRKTDQFGEGTEIPLPAKDDALVCPVTALKGWIKASGIEVGALFRGVTRGDTLRDGRLGDDVVADVIKAATAAAGYDAETFSGHSLRSGFVTTAARAGVAESRIMAQTGHKSTVVLRGYIRRASLFKDTAASDI